MRIRKWLKKWFKGLLAIFMLSIAVAAPAHAARFYVDLGIGTFNQNNALPEIDLQSPLAKYVIGVEGQDNWFMEYEHISSVPQKEIGHGLDILWFSKRIYFD